MKHNTVAYIITKLELGGAQKVCLSLFKALQNSGQKTFLISGSEGILVDDIKDNPNVLLLDSLKREIRVLSIFQEFTVFYKLVKLLRNLKKIHPDLIVHTHSTKAGVLGRWAAVFAGIKIRIHTVHGYAFHSYQNFISWVLLYFIELLCSPITSHFICVSQADAQTGCRLLPGFSKKYSLIRAAVESTKFALPAYKIAKFPAVQGQLFIFGTIACFKPQKNIFDLLKAFKYVHTHNPSTRLEIIGDGILRNSIERWIATNNLTQNIILHGWQKDIVPFLERWHCFALTSLWEGLPCALIEARLAKLPIVAYNIGGISEICHSGINGFTYKPKDWSNLAKGMLSLSNDELLFITVRFYPDNLREFDTVFMTNKHQALYQQYSIFKKHVKSSQI